MQVQMSKKNKKTIIWNPLYMASDIWSYRELIQQFTKRELIGRYKGSYLGILWSFLTPLFMLLVYTFVFSVIFKAKWGVGSGSKTEFALTLFCGLIAFNIFSEVVGRAPALILSNVNYVKKVVFPLQILPVITLASSLIHAIISLFILVLGLLLTMGIFNWTMVFLPIILLPLLLSSLGLAWFLASIGVFLRDVGHVIGIIISALMFLSPVFYPISAIPENLRPIYYINPLTYVVEDIRRVMIWGQMPDWKFLIIGTCVSMVIAVFGYSWFQRTRGGFADVI